MNLTGWINVELMRFALSIILIFRLALIYPQELKPGGVQGALVWNVTKATMQGEAQWKSNIKGNNASMLISGSRAMINNHPAIIFNNKVNSKALTLNLAELKTFSMFTVCQETDSLTEQVIFSLENDSLTQLVLSNFRMAALDLYRYYNYSSNSNDYPKIYSYSQNQSDSSASHASKLLFGRSPQRANLPVSSYMGIVPEVILFNHYLSPNERHRVESYLALKYGISLRQDFPNSYLNSSGAIIWDARVNAGYNQHIAGIGRDDLTGLLQYTSESVESPGILKISTSQTLVNNSFLIWGDNNKPLRFDDKPGVRQFQREWRINAYNSSNRVCKLQSNELAFSQINPLTEGEIYWLMIDESGTGKFPFDKTEYIRSQHRVSGDRSIIYTPVHIDSDSSGSDVITLLIAPPFFTRSEVLSPDCSDQVAGTIQTRIAGGRGPYKMTLVSKATGETIQTLTEQHDKHVFNNISQGGYTLYVTDANHLNFSENIWVSNAHAWESSVRTSYHLREGEKLHLNASGGMPNGDFQYTWTTPDGQTINAPDITISQPGKYLLSTTGENGCTVTQEISILPADKSIFRNTQLFPNPVRGWFVLRIELANPADVRVIIYDINGRLISRENMYGQQYYSYTNTIDSPGVYTITMESGNEMKTLKLVVE